ncbi:uncharacterized protein NEPG_00012 [Nematocida parisii ERTm1]|uniref:uncharacterized protein n=1 Tax=Nematocida parisii (strain ERTm1 / ATCC PRA-289) TaxID=881290 RepID=UPI000264BB95|nr:uncharacterized protein NEPG_00012 [Nematocida parisii ERTm1]EIJ94490.1 hypothetical protein NEPG_00012 [Nematocida parisii ERTm1]|eukprot:XP_013057846.1 hypothetical protein NEPG_00012 [Nematocida parisii ERTm1]
MYTTFYLYFIHLIRMHAFGSLFSHVISIPIRSLFLEISIVSETGTKRFTAVYSEDISTWIVNEELLDQQNMRVLLDFDFVLYLSAPSSVYTHQVQDLAKVILNEKEPVPFSLLYSALKKKYGKKLEKKKHYYILLRSSPYFISMTFFDVDGNRKRVWTVNRERLDALEKTKHLVQSISIDMTEVNEKIIVTYNKRNNADTLPPSEKKPSLLTISREEDISESATENSSNSEYTHSPM